MSDIILVPGTPSDSEDELQSSKHVTSTPLTTRRHFDFTGLDVSSIPTSGTSPPSVTNVTCRRDVNSETDVFLSFTTSRRARKDSSSSEDEIFDTIIGTPSSFEEKKSRSSEGMNPTMVEDPSKVPTEDTAKHRNKEHPRTSASEPQSTNHGKVKEKFVYKTKAISREPEREMEEKSDDTTVLVNEVAGDLSHIDLCDSPAASKIPEFTIDDLTDSLREVNIDKNRAVQLARSRDSSPELIEVVPKSSHVFSRPQVIEPPRKDPSIKFPARKQTIFLNDLPQPSVIPKGSDHLRGSVGKLLTRLQKIIASVPEDDGHDVLGEPELLKTELYNHQKYGLKWLWWREAEKPYGGILADEMGLGKTVMILALICRSKSECKENNIPSHWDSKEHERLIPSRATLVVCPPSVMGQWEEEIKKKSSGIRVLMYHGTNRAKSASILAQYDVVLTTYNTLGSEIPKLTEQTAQACRSPVIRVGWLRIVLDEGHIIRNAKTTGAQAVCRINARHRWVVTGTPVHNKPADMFSLVKFLRLSPFDDPQVWESWIGMKQVGKQNAERLCTVAKCLLLRRTKDEVMSQRVDEGNAMQSIPPKTILDVMVELKPEELEIYDHLDSFATKEFRLFLKEKEKRQEDLQKAANQFMAGSRRPPKNVEERSFTHIFTLILRLRQCAVLPHLIQGMIEDEEDIDDSVEFDPLEDIITKKNPVFSDNYKSAKIEKMLEDIDDLKQQCRSRGERMEKVIVVSQWTSLLKIVDMHLRAKGYSTSTISGEIKISDRTDIMMKFNADPKRPQIMLLSLTAGGVGLNLTGANHLFFLDIHWNPQLELQAQDRVHRFGQKKPVTIRRYISKGTIENRIVELQKSKLELADGILNTAQKKNGTGLNIAEMRQLFGV